MTPAFRRILLKLSEEALMGDLDYGAEPERIAAIAHQVKRVADRGVEVAIVVGGGNVYRGLSAAAGMDRATRRLHGHARHGPERTGAPGRAREGRGRHPGAVRDHDLRTRGAYIRRRAMRHLERGRIVIFAAGSGNPFFTTDTAAALRALEIHAEAILMAKNRVEGVYTADPRAEPDARFIPELTHQEAIERRLTVMDSTALSLCMDNGLPIYVFNMDDERDIDRIVCGERVGTLVSTSA